MKTVLTILRTLGAVAAVLMLLWFIAPIVRYRTINIGNITGIVLCIWTILMCIAPVQRRISEKCKRFTATKILYRAVCVIYAIIMVYGAAATAAILFYASGAPEPDSTVLVLGAYVSPSSNPSIILNGRIKAAENYLNEHPDAKAVLSGGKGSDEVLSEAQCMYNTMTADGIAPERLLMEDRATDTVENFRYSMDIIKENGLNENLAVVTDGFHQFRARLIADRAGYNIKAGAVNAQTEPIFIPTYIVREWFALPTIFFKN